MALISMAVYDTVENKRTEYTAKTLECLLQTVNLARHPVHVIDNGSCDSTKNLLKKFDAYITIHTNQENLGTAKAVNIGWKHRQPGEHCIKIDNDVVIHSKGWACELEEAVKLDPSIGIVGLKRKDCWENPNHENPHYKSTLDLIGGGNNKWIPIEKVNHVMGTCQLYNSDLLDKIGYLYQPRLYGFDDALAAVRCQVAGFYSCFLPHIEIEHIDTGETPYQGWKERHSGEDMAAYNLLKNSYINGTKSIYYDSMY